MMHRIPLLDQLNCIHPPIHTSTAKKNQYNNNKQSKLNFIIYTQLLSCQIPGIMYQNIYVFFSFPFPLSTKIEISKKKKIYLEM